MVEDPSGISEILKNISRGKATPTSNSDASDLSYGRYLANSGNVSDYARHMYSLGRFGVTEIGQTGKVKRRGD